MTAELLGYAGAISGFTKTYVGERWLRAIALPAHYRFRGTRIQNRAAFDYHAASRVFLLGMRSLRSGAKVANLKRSELKTSGSRFL